MAEEFLPAGLTSREDFRRRLEGGEVFYLEDIGVMGRAYYSPSMQGAERYRWEYKGDDDAIIGIWMAWDSMLILKGENRELPRRKPLL